MELECPGRVSKHCLGCKAVLTIVSVGRFNESDRSRIFFVGQSKLNAFPAACWVIEYTSSAYSGRFPSATSHMPSRNFIVR
jgi:hypothetical protein